MKFQVWGFETLSSYRVAIPRPSRRKPKSIAQILRAAYRLHGKDSHTQRAVKRYLR